MGAAGYQGARSECLACPANQSQLGASGHLGQVQGPVLGPSSCCACWAALPQVCRGRRVQQRGGPVPAAAVPGRPCAAAAAVPRGGEAETWTMICCSSCVCSSNQADREQWLQYLEAVWLPLPYFPVCSLFQRLLTPCLFYGVWHAWWLALAAVPMCGRGV